MKKHLPRPFKAYYVLILFFVGSTLISYSQCIPSFGKASHFALFTVTGAIGGVGMSNITGDIGSNAGAIAGFDAPSILDGTLYNANAYTAEVAADLISTYNQLFSFTPTNSNHAPAFGSGETLTEGIYAIAGAGSVGGNLTLDAEGNPDAIFIFKIGGAFTTGAASHVFLTNGAQAANIFWVVDGAIAMAANTNMSGTLIANNGAASMGDQCVLHGRLFSTTGAIAIYASVINLSGTEGFAVGGNVSISQSICYGSSPNDLTLSENTGTVINWERDIEPTFSSPVSIDVNSNILTGSSIGNLMTTTYFRAKSQKNGCATTTAFSSVVTVTVASTIWNESAWSNGIPINTTSAIIQNDMISSGNITACSFTVKNGAHVTIRSGDTITLNGALIIENGGSFTLQNDANLIQTTNVLNTDIISIIRTTAPLQRQDYVLWSSPVSGQMFQAFSPATLANRFYSYDPYLDTFASIASVATTVFMSGSSYLIRMPNNHPATPTVWTGTFTGIPNNGNFNLTVVNNAFNAVGNPYPSGINANIFMSENNITDALYLWRKTNNANNSSYAVYTKAGGTSNSGGDTMQLTPSMIIPAEQGFLVKTTSDHLIFNNAMRVSSVNVPFLRITNEKSRIWLDMTNTAGFFGQTMIAYMPESTLGIDAAIDGRFINDSPTALTSIINNEEFSIQGRPLPFEIEDRVALGFKSELANTFTIAINHVDGIFEASQNVFLKDNITGIETNLSTSSYTFDTAAGIFNNRFELVYQNTLATIQNAFDSENVFIYKQNQNLMINAGNTTMEKVAVYDISGRLLFSKKNINATETQIALASNGAILIVKITSNDHKTVVKKVIN
jgi:hypothetical protein